MITRFRFALEAAPWFYRRLLWEAGMIGQVLYLEAVDDQRLTTLPPYYHLQNQEPIK